MSRKRDRTVAQTQLSADIPTDQSATTRSSNTSIPCHRDCSNLFVHSQTYHCALVQKCIACAYKIGCFDVALDTEFCRRVPNVRPETCPRMMAMVQNAKNNAVTPKDTTTTTPREAATTTEENILNGMLLYEPGMRVLTCGDGDLSFSLAVARLVGGPNLFASSYETKETLLRVYDNMEQTFHELEELGASIWFQVDATKLCDVMPQLVSSSAGSEMMMFDRIVWNFPCTAVAKGQDGQNQEMERNKDLVRKFAEQARHLLKPNGQIHITHKTKVPPVKDQKRYLFTYLSIHCP
jgi:25S rRNA (uracil2634-N3)-methyltransferase